MLSTNIYVAKEQPLACLSIILIMLLSKNILLMKFQIHRKSDFLVYFFWLLLTFLGTLILNVFFGLVCFVLCCVVCYFFFRYSTPGVVVTFRNTASFKRMNFWFTFFLPGGLDDSVILANDASKISQLNTWLLPHLQSPDRSYWKLCYRASNHGWSSQTFHSNCDNKGPTVTIVRVGIYIFGGYNDNSWQCKSLK